MDYLFGRAVLSFLGLVSIVLVILGGVVAFSGAMAGFSVPNDLLPGFPVEYLGAIPGIVIMLFGVILLAVVDHFSATFDTATATKKMLRVAEEQLHVSKEAIRLGRQTNATFAAAAGVPLPTEPEPLVAGRRGGFFGLFRKPQAPKAQGHVGTSGKHAEPSVSASAPDTPELEPKQIEKAPSFSKPSFDAPADDRALSRLNGPDRDGSNSPSKPG